MEEFDQLISDQDGGGGYRSGGDDDTRSLESGSGLSVQSDGSGYLRREQFTDSMLNQDVLAPHIVHFTHNTVQHKKKATRRIFVLVVVLVLSLSTILHLRKLLLPFSHEADLDIEVKMTTAAAAATTTTSGYDGSTKDIP